MGKKSILIVDDEEMSRELLKQMFENEYKILTAKDGREALSVIGRHANDIAVILLDIVMPVLNGFQLLQILNAKKMIDEIPVILITAQRDVKTELACYSLGASSVISKPFVAHSVRMQVRSIIKLNDKAGSLQERLSKEQAVVTEQRTELNNYYDNLFATISSIVEVKVPETAVHLERVKEITRILGQTYMRLYQNSGLTKDYIDDIARVAMLHDIGKIAIPDSIILKPGSLNSDEWEIMKSHSAKGCEVLNLVEGRFDKKLKDLAYEVCRYHHERYDGSGYPDGLKGDKIPIHAQIVGMADAYESLINERVYKRAFSKDVAYQMILSGECGEFSPQLIRCFEQSKNAIEVMVDTVE